MIVCCSFLRLSVSPACLHLAVEPIDHPDQPSYGYTTKSFSDEAGGRKGELDRYCAFERSIYFIVIGLMFTFMVTIVLSVLRICEGSYTKNTRVNELLDSLERANEKEQQSPLLHTGPRFMPPPSEGIITRQTSVRSVATTNHVGPASYSSLPAITRRPVPNRTSMGLAISPIDEASETRGDEEYEALVADGMRHQPQQQHHYTSIQPQHQQPTPQQPQQMSMLEENDRSSLSEAGMVADGMQYRPNNQHIDNFEQQEAPEHYVVSPATAPLDEESAALVSDGSRPMPNLPPYTPGSSRMPDQVSVQPRTLDMKPNGYFKQ